MHGSCVPGLPLWADEGSRTGVDDAPPDFREALVAVDMLGLSYREASRALKAPEATIASRLFRARKRVAAPAHV
jgi:DNA-directed RNA polymerase specialized sigma24 family protein